MQIPKSITISVSAGAGSTPSVALASPGAGVSWVIERVQSRLENVSGAAFGVQLTVTDAILGVIYKWALLAPSGGLDDIDQDSLGLPGSPAAAVTAAWTAAVPVSSIGFLTVIAHLDG